MSYSQHVLFTSLWMSWGLYWLALWGNVKPTTRHESWSARIIHMMPIAIAVLLIWIPHIPVPLLELRIVPRTGWPIWVGLLLTVGGLLFTVWARRHIGRNWSITVTVKEGHELVTSGPYSLVRHPIYTGLMFAFVGSALARAELRGILAIALVYWSLWRKLRIEERWMSDEFGEAYQNYCRKVPALLPSASKMLGLGCNK